MVRSGWCGTVVVAMLGCGDNTPGVVDATIGPEPGPAAILATPSRLDFGTAGLTTEVLASLTVTNIGHSASGPLMTTVLGTDAGSFAAASTTCTTLAPGATCTVALKFAPLTVGAKTAALQLTVSPSGALTIPLLGTALSGPGGLIVSPALHDFGTLPTGTPSTARTFTIMNPSGITFGAMVVTPAGTNPTDFSITSQTCDGAVLAPSAACTIDVVFTPTATGARSASFVLSASPGGTASAVVTGIGQ